MKMIDLDNVDRYFTMGGLPFYKTIGYSGDIRYIEGTALNTIEKTETDFAILLDHNDVINIKINNQIISI